MFNCRRYKLNAVQLREDREGFVVRQGLELVFRLPSTVTFNPVPQVGMTPNHKIGLFQPHYCNFAIVMDCNVDV